jgi:fatty acid amide hydrolase
MARWVEDLELAMQALAAGTDENPGLDGVSVAMGKPSGIRFDQLRIGMYTELQSIRCAPALRRAVDEAAEVLRQRGATVEPFTPPDIEEAWGIFLKLFYADGLYYVRRALKGSECDWRVRQFTRFAMPPAWLRPALAMLLNGLGQRRMGHSFQMLRERVLATPQYQQLLYQQQAYRQRFARALQARGLDAIICPPSPSPAITHGEFYANFGLVYTALFNLLGTPAGVVATTRVREGEETDRAESRDVVDRALARIESATAGLPVGVQIVSRWWREDVVLAVMGALEEHFRGEEDGLRQPPC